MLEGIPLPRVAPVAQHYDRPRVADIETEIIRLLREKGTFARLKQGQTVAVTAGSRGITGFPLALRAIVREVKAAGGVPFLVPAMGSHGGATAEGQLTLLKGLGIDEDTVEAPIRASMETVVLGKTPGDIPVHMDKHAAGADWIIAVNRVKPHTSYRGAIESGIAKMLAIGLGKQKGAEISHKLGFGRMAENVPAFAGVMLAGRKILCGIGIIENAFHETASIHVFDGEEILSREPELLKEAWRLAPKIFFDSLDVLVVDEIGKDIAGTGFDCNVVGRFHNPYGYGGPDITRLAVLDLTEKSNGNITGLGMADCTTRRAYAKFDTEQSYPNALTSTATLAVKMPLVFMSDRLAIKAAVKTCNIENLADVRLVRIKNTLDMGTIFVSETLKDYCLAHPNLEIVGDFAPFAFDDHGNLW